ncbi:MAG: acetoin utilization protein AcuC [Micromonosporaceae bacterium]
MGETLQVVWDEALTAYDFGPGHPLAPVRVELTMALARELGVFDAPGVSMTVPEPADDRLLRLIHDEAYIAAVRHAGNVLVPDPAWGLGTPDNPVFAGMHEVSALVAGATVAAANAVWTGAAGHAANVAGGLHHAMRAAASGFCVYNDPAIAITWLLAQGAERVAYVDMDVHHGDGVQAAFYDDPRVLTISLHEHPRTLFPGTGLPGETGTGAGAGYAVNVALPAGTGDTGWLRAFDAVVPPLVHAFRPQILVSQHGCDSHRLDPLAHLELSIDAMLAAYAAIHKLAHETAGGRWVLTGGGGYALVQVVPRAWTHLLAEAAGQPVAPLAHIPDRWREYARSRTGEDAPEWMTDGEPAVHRPFKDGYDPADPVDRSIMATRMAIFPSHGMDPHP